MPRNNENGWIAVQSQIVGNMESHEHSYSRTGRTHPSRALAISEGFSQFGHDDFNIGQVKNDRLVWWGWMDEPLLEDLVSVAAALGLGRADG